MNKPTPEQLEEIKTGLFSDEAPKPPALKANNNDRKGCNVVPKEQIKPAKVTEGDDGNVQIAYSTPCRHLIPSDLGTPFHLISTPDSTAIRHP